MTADEIIRQFTDDEIVEEITDPGRESCTLDMAENGPNTLEDIGDALNITRERVRQIEEGNKQGGAIRKLRHKTRAKFLRPWVKE